MFTEKIDIVLLSTYKHRFFTFLENCQKNTLLVQYTKKWTWLHYYHQLILNGKHIPFFFQ